MQKMICPECGYSVYDHPNARRELFSGMVIVDAGLSKCNLTEAEAMHAAQRHAAAVGLLAIRDSLKLWGETEIDIYGLRGELLGYQQAIRDLGVQRPRTVKE